MLSSPRWHKELTTLAIRSNKLLTSGWWAWARKPVSLVDSDIASDQLTLVTTDSELYCRLDPVLDLGSLGGSQHPDHLLLPGVLYDRLNPSMWTRL